MPTKVHAHDVLHLIVDADPALTPDRLRQLADERFGGECRFHTCSASDMNLDELLRFFVERKKIALVDGTITAAASAICDHD